MKIAILHEMLVKLGGAEKVVSKLLEIFPSAELFTLIYDEKKVGKIFPKNIINKQVFDLASQKRYALFKKQRLCLNLMAKSVEKLDFSTYDIVIASSSGFAHGAITKPETKFIVYSHSPARYIWDYTNEYKKNIGFDKGIKGLLLNKLFLKLRLWDFIASSRSDIIIANSKNTANRIQKYYKKDSLIIYPPVETERFNKKIENNNFIKPYTNYYIIISALSEFKKIEIAINNFNKIPNKNLIIVGDGDYRKKLESYAIGSKNISFLGAKYDDELVFLVQNSLGLIFPGEEDFGIVPIEVMSAGKPVFAYKAGGLLETNIAGITGEFFIDKTGEDFIGEFLKFDENIKNGKYNSKSIINHAKSFSSTNFEEKIKNIVYS